MLKELTVRDFAIIEESKILFENGLNIISGETGAGKSIILTAIKLLTGARANREMIRQGKESSFIEGIFEPAEDKLDDILNKFGIPKEGTRLIVSRIISREANNHIRVNGASLTLNSLTDLMINLIDICGQFDNLEILKSENQLSVLDMLSGDKHRIDIEVQRQLYREYIALKTELSEVNIDENKRNLELDLLNYQIEEIDSFEMEGTEDELADSFKRTENVLKIASHTNDAVDSLNTDSYSGTSGLDVAINHLSKASVFDSQIGEYLSRAELIREELNELKYDIEAYSSDLVFDEEVYEELKEKLNTLNKLKNKYGKNLDDIYLYRDELFKRRNILLNHEENIARINDNLNKTVFEMEKQSELLRKARLETARRFEKDLENILRELNMPYATFKIEIEDSSISERGYDRVNFKISTNKGEELKSMESVVSGGELSRIMLAFKSILADYEDTPTLIFDEIDTGISGLTGKIVGDKIKRISKAHQVICISHLPQIVALGDKNFLVEKIFDNFGTVSAVRSVSGEERIEMIARLIDGDASSASVETAKKLLS